MGTQGFSFRTRRETSAIRFGADAARIALTGRTAHVVDVSAVVTLTRSGEKQMTLNGSFGGEPGCVAPRPADARVHARPPRGREGPAGDSPHVPRPRARPAPPRPIAGSGRVCAGGGAAQRRAPPDTGPALAAGRAGSVGRGGRGSRPRPRRRSHGGNRRLRPALRRARVGARSCGSGSRLPQGRAHGRAARCPARARSRARHHRRRPAPGGPRADRGRDRPADVRLSGPATPCAAGAPPGGGSGHRRPDAARSPSCCSTTSSASSTIAGGRLSSRGFRRGGRCSSPARAIVRCRAAVARQTR